MAEKATRRFSFSYRWNAMLRSPESLLAMASVLACVLIAVVGWQSWRSYGEFNRVVRDHYELQSLADTLGTLDGLTDQARLAASGSERAARDYRELAERANGVISRMAERANSPEMVAAVAELRAANSELVAREEIAIDLARRGDTKTAIDIVFNAEYSRLVARYDAARATATTTVTHKLQDDIAQLERRSLLSLVAFGMASPALLVLAVSTLSRILLLSRRRDALDEELVRLSLHDELTGLLNRRGFLNLARQQEHVVRRSGERMALLFCDLDGLKPINDRFGHDAGDEAIRAAATVLRETFRASDIVARMGGDEFVVLFSDVANGGTDRAMSRLREGVENFNASSGRPWELSISVGLSILDAASGMSVDDAMAEADNRMYAAKHRARREAAPADPSAAE